MNIKWKEFDRIMIEIEWLFSKNRLSHTFVKALKRNKCWKNNAPYCSWENFTYKLTNDQIADICRSYTVLKG